MESRGQFSTASTAFFVFHANPHVENHFVEKPVQDACIKIHGCGYPASAGHLQIPPFRRLFSREKRRTSALILRKTVDLSTIKRRLWITLWINAAILTDFCGFSTEIPGKFLTVPGNLWKTIQPRQNRRKVFQSPSRCILSKPPCMKRLRPRSRGGCLQCRSATADPGASLPQSCRSRSRPCCGPS